MRTNPNSNALPSSAHPISVVFLLCLSTSTVDALRVYLSKWIHLACLALAVALGCISGASFAADEFTLLKEERIGNLRIGLSEKDVRKAIPCPLKRGPDTLWGADGAYHQEWKFVDCGIRLSMVSENKGAAKSIESILLASPSTLSTKRNIRIGSAKQEVIKAYKSHWNKEDSKLSEGFVAGSIYGGVMFTFENNKVSSIFLGAAAE